MKIIQQKSAAAAIAEVLSYGSPRPDHDHKIIDNGGSYTVLVNIPTTEVETEGIELFSFDDIAIATGEAIENNPDLASAIVARLKIMLNK